MHYRSFARQIVIRNLLLLNRLESLIRAVVNYNRFSRALNRSGSVIVR